MTHKEDLATVKSSTVQDTSRPPVFLFILPVPDTELALLSAISHHRYDLPPASLVAMRQLNIIPADKITGAFGNAHLFGHKR